MARITDSGAAFGKLKKSNVKIKITDDFMYIHFLILFFLYIQVEMYLYYNS